MIQHKNKHKFLDLFLTSKKKNNSKLKKKSNKYITIKRSALI